MSSFVQRCVEAFAELTARFGYTLSRPVETGINERVEWRRDDLVLAVTDDRLEERVEVWFERPPPPGAKESQLTMREGRVVVPLWAVVVAEDGIGKEALVEGADRWAGLPGLADLVATYGKAMLGRDEPDLSRIRDLVREAEANRSAPSPAERAGLTLRAARDADWPAIWPFLRDIVAAGETYTWPRDLGEEQAREMWLLEPPGHTVVAVNADGAVVGSAKMNPNHLGPGSHIATASFMVDPVYGGHGVGRALGEYALVWARRAGFRAMQFNAVVETNRRAVALWRSLGFEVIGTLPEGFAHPVHGYVGLHIMYRRL